MSGKVYGYTDENGIDRCDEGHVVCSVCEKCAFCGDCDHVSDGVEITKEEAMNEWSTEVEWTTDEHGNQWCNDGSFILVDQTDGPTLEDEQGGDTPPCPNCDETDCGGNCFGEGGTEYDDDLSVEVVPEPVVDGGSRSQETTTSGEEHAMTNAERKAAGMARGQAEFERLLAESAPVATTQAQVEAFVARALAADDAQRKAEVKATMRSAYTKRRYEALTQDEAGRLWYMPQETPFDENVDGITPQVKVYGGTAREGGPQVSEKYDFDKTWTLNELVLELIEDMLGSVGSRAPRKDVGSIVRIEANESAEEQREEYREEMFQNWLDAQTPEDEGKIVHRWARPDDDLYVLDYIVEHDYQPYNHEILTAIRRTQVHALAKEYFGCANYSDCEIVTVWKKDERGKRTPGTKYNVLTWIDMLCSGGVLHGEGEDVALRGGDRLEGYMSAAQTLRGKLKAKRRITWQARILTDAACREIIEQTVAALAQGDDVDWTLDDALQSMSEENEWFYHEIEEMHAALDAAVIWKPGQHTPICGGCGQQCGGGTECSAVDHSWEHANAEYRNLSDEAAAEYMDMTHEAGQAL